MARVAAIALALAALSVTGSAAAHGGAHAPALEGGRDAVKLRECWMTVAYVPRPAEVLSRAFPTRPDLSETFYGADPLLGVWAVSCARGRVAGERVGRILLSLVGVPVALTAPGAPPLANFFQHALIRADTNSRPLARALRRVGLPARTAPAARYRHSRAGVVPFTGLLDLPGRYRLEVTAGTPDPTNPHRHANAFNYRPRTGRGAELGLATATAKDRFCFPPAAGCGATVSAPPGSVLARLLGGTSATARVGFDHAKIAGLDLSAHRSHR